MNLFIFSQMIGKPIFDPNREKLATLKDIVVYINPAEGKSEEIYPPLAGILVHAAGRDVWVSARKVAAFDARGVMLASTKIDLEHFVRRDGEILLGKDVLDKQLVDVEGKRVVRVNDLALGQVPGETTLRLLAVDVSFRALSRRILMSLSGARPQRSERLLDWASVQYFASNAPAVQLEVSHRRLEKLHPADLARILDDLSHQQRDEIVRSLDDAHVADALEELDSDEAADILEEIDDERASDILEEMRPDMAADVVADLDEERAEALLSLMDQEDSDDVRELLAYSEDSAGGIMTNEFLLLPATLEAAESLRTIRTMEEQPEFADYIYVAEPGSERVIGAVSLRDVVFHLDRTTTLEQLMEKDIVSVHPTTNAKEAAALLSTYSLRAIPVIDDDGSMLGIITFDDALDILLPDELRERIGHLSYHRRRNTEAELPQGAL